MVRSLRGSRSQEAWLSPLTFHLGICGRCCWEGWGVFSARDDVGLLISPPITLPRGATALRIPCMQPRLHPGH